MQRKLLRNCSRSSAVRYYNAKGEHDKAIADCNEAIRLNPKCEDAYKERGKAYLLKGECRISETAQGYNKETRVTLGIANGP